MIQSFRFYGNMWLRYAFFLLFFVMGMSTVSCRHRSEGPSTRGVPARVKAAIRAANEIDGKPYKWGGGHARLYDSGYDCSGCVSFVLNRAGLMRGSGTSSSLRNFGKAGKGKWITVYAKNGHSYLEIAGRRFDALGDGRGPRWFEHSRGMSGFSARHPVGL